MTSIEKQSLREPLMKRLAVFITSGYSGAILCVVGFAGLAMFIPVSAVFSAAAVALTGLYYGWQRALWVLIAAYVGFALLLAGVSVAENEQINFNAELLVMSAHWIPMLALAYILRLTQSLSYTFQSMVFFLVAAVLITFWSIADSGGLWNEFFNWLSQNRLAEMVQSSSFLAEQYQAVLPIMTGIVATSMMIIWTMSLLLARWWQCLLMKPGSFAAEFTNFKLGKVIAGCGLLFLASTTFGKTSVVVEIVAILMAIFLFQGIATVHFLLSKTNNGKIFLFIFYGALILSVRMPILPGLIAVLGMLENFVGLRNRMPASS